MKTQRGLMRNVAPSLLLVTLLAGSLAVPLAAENYGPVGKKPSWEIWGDDVRPSPTPSPVAESMETPNQRRRRLGQPIEASYPQGVEGVAEETPNQRRRRLEGVPGLAKTTDAPLALR